MFGPCEQWRCNTAVGVCNAEVNEGGCEQPLLSWGAAWRLRCHGPLGAELLIVSIFTFLPGRMQKLAPRPSCPLPFLPSLPPGWPMYQNFLYSSRVDEIWWLSACREVHGEFRMPCSFQIAWLAWQWCCYLKKGCKIMSSSMDTLNFQYLSCIGHNCG